MENVNDIAQITKKPGIFVVAVHGIGDQVAYETIQTVAHQCCHYFNIPSATLSARSIQP